MKKLKTVVAYLAKNGAQVIKLSKKDIRELQKLIKMCDKWLADFKKLKKASPTWYCGRGYESHPGKRRGR